MKKIFIVFLMVVLTNFGIAQDYSDKQNMEVIMQQDAYYPKGEMALYKHIFMNVKYSEEAKNVDLEGEVMASFNVEPDSVVSNIIVIKGVGYGVDEEIKRLLSIMKFAPAIQNGEKTKMNLMFNFPIRAH